MAKFTLYDFDCAKCGHTFESYVKPDVLTTPCPECQSVAVRLISCPTISLSGTDPGFPGAYDQWERKRKAKAAEDAKFYDRHGVDKKHHSYGS